mgnify:CR=1 FL=1
MKYDHKNIEQKWRQKWAERDLYKTEEKEGREKYYILDMFPYPSGAGLHVGHPKGYIATDVFARMKMMQGYNVLHPMGWDAFGLPAENYALKNKTHPRTATEENIKTFKGQLEKLGFTYDWDREINTTDPEFYKWTQWIFLQMFKKGLAYESYEPINWCPSCQTGLANEDLENGKCERCGSEVEQKPMRQWVLKITDYADRLLDDIEKLDEWDESIKEMQKNWIGRSFGAKIKFSLRNSRTDAEHTRNFAEEDNAEGLLYKNLTYKIRGALFKVKKEIGLGHKENIYHKALEEKFKNLGLKFDSEKQLDVKYNGKKIGVYTPDFIIEDKIIIELKALPKVGKQQTNQVWTYLKGNEYKLALLANFSPNELEVRRIIYDKARNKDFPRESASVPRSSATSTSALSEVEVFTTRPDTLFGATYFVVAPEHPIIKNQKSKIKNQKEVEKYIEKAKKKTELERTDLAKEKAGVKLEGVVAVNPVNGEELPVFVADYVMMHYGTGAIMAVPAHDERDYEFAQNLNKELRIKNNEEIKVKPVVKPKENEDKDFVDKVLEGEECFSGEGVNVNSDFLDGLETKEAKEKMIEWLEENNLGKRDINYKLKDWVFSRQRYWGEPIPIVHCKECGAVGVPEKDLPVELPEVDHYEPTGTGESPLAGITDWVNTTCPECGGDAQRETNTMPQWAGSSWYYLRFIDPHNDKALVDKDKEKYWSPVDFYVGGAEHATRHLIYARFWHKFLYDIGSVNYSEPFRRLQHVGIILAEDGRKMSKRWGNVINPDDIVEQYGADSMRVYEMFMGPFSQSTAWSTNGLIGARKFLEKVWSLKERVSEKEDDKEAVSLLHKTIKKVGEDIEGFKLNTAVSAMMILVNKLTEVETVSKETYESLLKILSPFAPHLCEEIWEDLGEKESIFKQSWPEFDPELARDETIELVIQVNGKVRDKMEVPADIEEEEAKKEALEREKIKSWIEGKEIVKIVFVPGKLVNIVVK